MAVSAKDQAEIKRKASLGIPLTHRTTETTRLYAGYQASAKAAAVKKPTPTVSKSTTVVGRVAETVARSIGSAVHSAASVVSVQAVGTSSPKSKTKAQREAEYAAFTGWDNTPGVRDLQDKAWHLYVESGDWNSAAQNELHKQAERIRQYNNPMSPSTSTGPIDWMDAEKIYPRDTTPGADQLEGGADSLLNPDKFGGYLKAGAGVLFLFLIVSMFRR